MRKTECLMWMSGCPLHRRSPPFSSRGSLLAEGSLLVMRALEGRATNSSCSWTNDERLRAGSELSLLESSPHRTAQQDAA